MEGTHEDHRGKSCCMIPECVRWWVVWILLLEAVVVFAYVGWRSKIHRQLSVQHHFAITPLRIQQKIYMLNLSRSGRVLARKPLRMSQYARSNGSSRPNVAFIALGSNLGDRAHNIHSAIDALRQLGEVKATSYLYQSAPMYFTDQAPFLNAAIELHVDAHRCASSHHLLRELKKIEAQCGRQKTFANGPRVIDLDLLFFNDEISTIAVDDLPLAVPHPRIVERDFVLKPLVDIAPHFHHPTAQQTIEQLWQQFQQQQSEKSPSAGSDAPATRIPLRRVIPCMNRVLKRTKYLTLGERPLIMGILNLTPDSFSDGGVHIGPAADVLSSSSSSTAAASISPAMKHFARLVADGADIVDIGGESTRPNAAFVTEDDEIQRILPVIRYVASFFPSH